MRSSAAAMASPTEYGRPATSASFHSSSTASAAARPSSNDRAASRDTCPFCASVVTMRRVETYACSACRYATAPFGSPADTQPVSKHASSKNTPAHTVFMLISNQKKSVASTYSPAGSIETDKPDTAAPRSKCWSTSPVAASTFQKFA